MTWSTGRRTRASPNAGFNHDYDGYVEDGDGEDLFLDLIDQVLTPDADLLDVGCGHGDLTLELAARARSAAGVDRTQVLIDLARELATERGADNVRFEHAELVAPHEDHPGGPLPLPDSSVDLVIDSRGPSIERFVDDLRRIGRPGTTVIGVHPAGGPPAPAWADELPTFRHRFDPIDPRVIESWVVNPALTRGLDAFRLWWVDVPEHLPNAQALYDKLKFDHAPPFDTVADELGGVFNRHANDRGIALRHQRLVFTLGSVKRPLQRGQHKPLLEFGPRALPGDGHSARRPLRRGGPSRSC